MLRSLVFCTLTLGLVLPVCSLHGQQRYGQFASNYQPSWAANLIATPRHNFGIVARGSEHTHVFEFENNLQKDIVLGNVRASCGCATPTVLTPTVRPGEKGQIQVRFNTLSFLGDRHARITVSVRAPEYTELYMDIDGHVRRDIVVTPGQIQFGTIQTGTSAEQSVDIRYAGSGQWQVTKAECANPNVQLDLTETKREGMRIDYRLTAKLNSAAAGAINEQIILHTNDISQKQFPINVSGYVKSVVETQSVVDVGRLHQGKPAVHRVVLKSDQEFVVTGVQTNGNQIKVKASEDRKRLHILEVEVEPDIQGHLEDEIVVSTDIQSGPTRIRIIGEILPAIETDNKDQ